MGSVDFSYNEITGVDNSHGTYKGINAASVSLSNNKIEKFPSELFTAGSPITTIALSGNLMRTIPKGSIKGKKAYLLQVIDFRFNKLTSLSDDFRSTTLPYITNMDLSYNCFTEVPTQPLNSAVLRAFAINHQRDAKTDADAQQPIPGRIPPPRKHLMQIDLADAGPEGQLRFGQILRFVKLRQPRQAV